MVQLKEIFNIKYGQRGLPFSNQEQGQTPFVSSKGTNRGVQGFVNLKENFKYCITMPRVGTIGHAFFHKPGILANENVLVLEPKLFLGEEEMVFYSLFLRTLKDKFMYGRQITPKRLGKILAPEKHEIPLWVYETEIPDYSDIVEAKENKLVELPDSSKWKEFLFSEVFNMERGKGGTATNATNNPGNNLYIGASGENNGITKYTSLKPTEQGNAITVANNGSVGASFFQKEDFLASSDVTVLRLKDRDLNGCIALFITTLIFDIAKSFDYGRKWGISRMKESKISLPVDLNGNPDWQLMEDYIKSLPYSKYLE